MREEGGEGRGGGLVVFSPSLAELDLFCGLLVYVEHQDSVPLYVGVDDEKVFHGVRGGAARTTTCLALVSKVVNDKFGTVEGLMTAMHAMTATQLIAYGPLSQWHASETVVPSSACAARTVAKVDPELNGRLA